MAVLFAVGVINLVMGFMNGDQKALQVGSVAVAMFAIYVIFTFGDELSAMVKPIKQLVSKKK